MNERIAHELMIMLHQQGFRFDHGVARAFFILDAAQSATLYRAGGQLEIPEDPPAEFTLDGFGAVLTARLWERGWFMRITKEGGWGSTYRYNPR